MFGEGKLRSYPESYSDPLLEEKATVFFLDLIIELEEVRLTSIISFLIIG